MKSDTQPTSKNTMKKKSPKSIQEIFFNKSFENLAPYCEEKNWGKLDENDRELLALLFLMQGEQLLNKGDKAAQDSFEMAKKIIPNSAKVYYRLAVAYSSFPHNGQCLINAIESIEKSIELESFHFKTWNAWGNILVALANHTQNINYLYDANDKFVEAYKLREQNTDSEEYQTFFWHWGICWHFIAKHSGEATDFHKTITKYRQAEQDGLSSALFLNDFGSALVDLGSLISRQELFFEAVDFYKKAVLSNPTFFECWYNLGCTYQSLYDLTDEDEYFDLADESFKKASAINVDSYQLWFKWGQLLGAAGKLRRNHDFLAESLEKLNKADQLQPHDPEILSKWAEILLMVGVHKEQLDLFRQAEQKIMLSLQMRPESSQNWYIYGHCLNEVGRYFADTKYYYQAIEKFQFGISINRADPLLWYGMALSHFAIGDLLQDIQLIEKSIRYCSKVMDFGGELFPQFWNDWGIALMKLGELTTEKHYIEMALEKFEEAIKRHTSEHDQTTLDPEWLYNYGCAFDFLGDFHDDERHYEKAVQVLTQALALNPDFTNARYNLALALSHLGEVTSDVECFYKAIEHFQIVVTIDTEDEMAWNDWGLTLMHLAHLLQDPSYPELVLKLQHQAEEKFCHAAALGSIYANYNLACLYSMYGNFDGAIHFLERAEHQGALPPLDDLMHDEWLEGLRSTHHFKNFLHHLSMKKG